MKKTLLALVLIIALAFSLNAAFAAEAPIRYDGSAPKAAEGEYVVNANGSWVTYENGKPYAEESTAPNGRAVVTYFVPLSETAKALGCTVNGTDVTYNGLKAASSEGLVEKDGVTYASSDYWAKAFPTVAKVTGSGSEIHVSLRTDADILLDIGGQDYTFKSTIFESKGESLWYRSASVNAEAEGKADLIIFLHGGSYRGEENIQPIRMSQLVTIVDYFERNNVKGDILVPQCPSDLMWVDRTEILGKAIEDYVAKNGVDPDRVYIAGCSIGGRGTFAMVQAFPDMFAAAMPISTDPSEFTCTGEALPIPLCFSVGGQDSQEMRDNAKQWVSEFRENGGIVEFDINADFTHPQNCGYGCTAGRLKWMFSFTRGEELKPLNYVCDYSTLGADEYGVLANGAWVEDAKAFAEDKVNYVAMQAVADAVNADVAKLDNDAYTVSYLGYSGTFTVGSDAIVINNGSPKGNTDAALKGKVIVKDGTVFVPLDFWSTAFAEVGANTATDASNAKLMHIRLRSNVSYQMNVNGNDYVYTAQTYYQEGTDVFVPYRATKINADKSGEAALVVFLHGSSYRGRDNIKQLRLEPVKVISDYLNKNGMKADFLLPQCIFMDKGTGAWIKSADAVVDLINEYIADNNIDPDRVYLCGVSMGGEGTWNLVSSNPTMFASAMAVAFNAVEPNVSYASIAKTPMMVVAGEKDTLDLTKTGAGVITATYNAIKAAGATARLQVMEGLGHVEVCDEAFTEENLDFIFSFVKGELAASQTGRYLTSSTLLSFFSSPLRAVNIFLSK